MRQTSLLALLILLAAAALVAPASTNASRGEEIAFKAALIPCFPDGESEAEGEAEWEQEVEGATQIGRVKIEVSGVHDLMGEELDVVVRFVEGDVDRPFVVGALYVGSDGRGSLTTTESRAELNGSEEMHVLVGADPVFASDPEDCRLP